MHAHDHNTVDERSVRVEQVIPNAELDDVFLVLVARDVVVAASRAALPAPNLSLHEQGKQRRRSLQCDMIEWHRKLQERFTCCSRPEANWPSWSKIATTGGTIVLASRVLSKLMDRESIRMGSCVGALRSADEKLRLLQKE